MVDQVDSMSDAELRTKLAEHGFPVMPVTASTRQLLVNKLKSVLDDKSKPRIRRDNNKVTRRSLPQTLSTEESGSATSNAKHKLVGRRATIGEVILQTKKELPVTSFNNEGVSNRRTLPQYSSGEESDLDANNGKEQPAIPKTTTRGATLPPAVSEKLRTMSKKESSVTKVDNKKAPNRRSLPQYSSGEESDLDASNGKEKPAIPKTTTRGATLPRAVSEKIRTMSKKESSVTKVDNKRAPNRRSLPQYSSGEESDLDASNGKKQRVDSKATSSGAILPPAVSESQRRTSKKELPGHCVKVSESNEQNSSSSEPDPPKKTKYFDLYVSLTKKLQLKCKYSSK